MLNFGRRLQLDFRRTNKPGYIMASCMGNPADVVPDAAVRNVIFDNDGFLDADGIRRWMESVVTRAANRVKSEYTVKVTRHGPAMALKISDGVRSVDIDLVPVFAFRLGYLEQRNPDMLRELGNLWNVSERLCSSYYNCEHYNLFFFHFYNFQLRRTRRWVTTKSSSPGGFDKEVSAVSKCAHSSPVDLA